MHDNVNKAGFTADEHDKMQVGYVDSDDNFYSQSSIHDVQHNEINEEDDHDQQHGSVATFDGQLSSASCSALKHYTNGAKGYKPSEKGMGNDKDVLGEIIAIKEAFKHSTLDDDETLYRGTGGYNGWQDVIENARKNGADSLVGTTIIKPSFQSFSKNTSTSSGFSEGVHITLHVPQGTPAIDINDHGVGVPDQNEVLLPYGAYKVTKATLLNRSSLWIEADFVNSGLELPIPEYNPDTDP